MRMQLFYKNAIPPSTRVVYTQNVDELTHPRSEVLGGNPQLEIS